MTASEPATQAAGSPTPLLETRGIVKQFPGVRALDGVDFQVDTGEVHCLLGQNGAGKSTLIKVLAGAHQPTSGEIRWAGNPVTLRRPTDALALGMAVIYQELDLVPGLSVHENIYLGHELSTGGFTDRKRARDLTVALLARLGHPEIAPNTEVATLSPAGQQLVSVARALSWDAKLLIMDEPSAALARTEVDNLFRVIRDLTGQGVAVVYISHRLDEIREIGDRVTVLKDGRTVGVGLPATTTPTADLVRLMTGRSIEYPFPPRPPAPDPDTRPVVLRVQGLGRPGEFTDVSFQVAAGEIVGLAGLVGAGRSELLAAVYGATRPASGTVELLGEPLGAGSPRKAVRRGMGLAPEERKLQALVLDEPVYRNVSLATLRRYSRLGFLDRGRELTETTDAARALDVRPDDPRRPIRLLSGGNQQKAVLSRWLLSGSKVLLLDEPTRGVDVGARAELYKLIRGLADDGVAIVLVSSDVPEVLGLADRVLVIRRGRLVHSAPAAELDEAGVLDLVLSDGQSLRPPAVEASSDPAGTPSGPHPQGGGP